MPDIESSYHFLGVITYDATASIGNVFGCRRYRLYVADGTERVLRVQNSTNESSPASFTVRFAKLTEA